MFYEIYRLLYPKEMATHSRTLAWKIPWTEERGRLQSMGIAKSRIRLSDFTSLHFIHVRSTYEANKGLRFCEKTKHTWDMKILNTPYTIRTQTFYGIVAWQERRSGFFFPYDLNIHFCLCCLVPCCLPILFICLLVLIV